jgi:hypothetical protein
MVECPVCKSESHHAGGGDLYVDCPRCGKFGLTGSLVATLQPELDAGIHRRALMSHNLRRMQRENAKLMLIDSYNVESFWLSERLPTPQRQADDLILWVGDHQLYPDEAIPCSLPLLSAWVGTSLNPTDSEGGGLHWLCSYLQDEGLLEPQQASPSTWTMRLTMPGWRKHTELEQKGAKSRSAFMALKFGQPELDEVIQKCFRPAVARAGFELRLLTENQPAGIIDDQLRAAILASRFVISDLTHASRGAYWEGGFGEGLGRPVIYTCQKSAWEKEKTHFDTNHLVTIIWDLAELKKAEDNLTATIRATLRADAKPTDD